jgi:hypothetical protein
MAHTQRLKAGLLAAVGVLCAVVLVLHWTLKGSEAPATTAGSSPAASRPTKGHQTTKATHDRQHQPTNRLVDYVHRFLTAYYHVGPKETEAEHKQYLASTVPFVDSTLLTKMYFGIEETRNQTNQQRWTQNLAMRAVENPRDLQVTRTRRTSHVLTVYGPVTVQLVHADGTVDSSYPVQTATKWRRAGGSWKLMGFAEYSAGSDAE